MGELAQEVHEHRLDIRIDDDRLAAVYTVPRDASPKSLVVMLHGGPGGQKDGPEGLYSTLAAVLARQGIASLRFDFRGMGDSSGRYRDMTIARQVADFNCVWSLARSWGFGRFGVIGESYGATIALHSRLADPDAVCLLWPAIYFLDGTFCPFVTPEKMAAARRDGFMVEDGPEVGLAFLEEVFEVRDVEAGVRRISAPTLLIHGVDDSEVPVRQSQRAFELLSEPKKLVTVPGADHCLVRREERELVNQQVGRWLDEYLC
ncbi:MAG: alpha/beta hydrolase [Mycobacteriales bacterium]